MRDFDNSDINSAVRGLGMWRQPAEYLDMLIATHGARSEFASRVIAEAARQVKDAKRRIAASQA